MALPPGWKVVEDPSSALAAYDTGFPDATVQVQAFDGTAEPDVLAAATRRNSQNQGLSDGPFLTRTADLASGLAVIVMFRTLEPPRGIVENEVYHLGGSDTTLVIYFKGPPPLTPLIKERFAEIAATVRFI